MNTERILALGNQDILEGECLLPKTYKGKNLEEVKSIVIYHNMNESAYKEIKVIGYTNKSYAEMCISDLLKNIYDIDGDSVKYKID